MATNVNERTYKRMIKEDIEALEKDMPKHSLEKKHIIHVLEWSIKQLYK